jgi:hypothetical protein
MRASWQKSNRRDRKWGTEKNVIEKKGQAQNKES